jgi:hypothetical protein
MNSLFISGVATCGKDTLKKILATILPKNIHLERFSFADDLKAELDHFCREKLGISAFTINPKEKELIRPLFVEFGLIKRIQSNGTYWWKRLQPKIENGIKDGDLPCVTDLRYAFYPEDEHFFAKNVVDGVIIHVTRFNKDGGEILAPNLQEKENDPKVKSISDYRLSWNTSDDMCYLEDVVKVQLKDLLDKINKKYAII